MARVLISGASGFVGSHLSRFLAGLGDEVVALVRREARLGAPEISWNPDRGEWDGNLPDGFDAVVNLAGQNIGAGSWTPQRKQAILQSRVQSTSLLCRTLALSQRPPRVVISASAVGFYGHRGDEAVDERSPCGRGFLADVCEQWEAATRPARDAGVRVVLLRLGMVLSGQGGALARMLGPFRIGLGGVVGSGRQYVSWIALTDLLRCVHHLMSAGDVAGPVNAVAPGAVTNRQFVRALAGVLHRPAVVPVPALLVKTLFGEMGRALLLEGARVLPARLSETGFVFRFPDVEAALRHELNLG